MAAIPDSPNFYSTLETTLTPELVAALYVPFGFRARKCSWTDWEIRSPWCEMVIADAGNILMHGPVADILVRAEELIAPLRAAGVTFTAECYGPEPERELLLELRS